MIIWRHVDPFNTLIYENQMSLVQRRGKGRGSLSH